MDTNLHGLSILVTRPLPEGLMLCQQIKACGGEAHYFPTITFAPPVDQTAFEQAITLLPSYDIVIFVSPRAVDMSIPFFEKLSLPKGMQFAAVGGGTAHALKKVGIDAIYPASESGSKALLAMPLLQLITQKKIAIIKGAGGRELLARTLVERGAFVTEVIAYQRELPVVSPEHTIQLFSQKKINTILCTSNEGVNNFKKMMGDDAWPLIKNIPLWVVSERIKTLSQTLGFKHVFLTKGTSNQAILNSFMENRDDE